MCKLLNISTLHIYCLFIWRFSSEIIISSLSPFLPLPLFISLYVCVCILINSYLACLNLDGLCILNFIYLVLSFLLLLLICYRAFVAFFKSYQKLLSKLSRRAISKFNWLSYSDIIQVSFFLNNILFLLLFLIVVI